MSHQKPVQEHYGEQDLTKRVEAALRQGGLGTGPVDWSELRRFDQFHVRGLSGTKELADMLGPESGKNLLDIGCGIGGTARFLAARLGIRVTGIDLNGPFIEVARMLTERTGQSGQVSFVQGDALDLPFEQGSFDLAWTQHVAMNIADRQGLYQNIYRVLKPGGRLAIHDVVIGNGEPLHFPVPWARTPQISHLITVSEMKDVLSTVGFEIENWADATDATIEWIAEQRSAPQTPGGLNLGLLMGADFPDMFMNLARNLTEGRARLVQAIVRTKQP